MAVRVSRSLVPVYLVFIGLVLFATRDYGQVAQSPVELSNLHKVAANCVAALMIAVYFMKHGVPRNWASAQRYYFVFIVSALASTLIYSTNFLYSIWKVFEVFLAFFLSLYMLSKASRDANVAWQFYEIALGFARFILVITFVGALLAPDVAIRSPMSAESMADFGAPILPYQIYGTIVQVNPNTLGAMSAILSFVHARRFLLGDRRFGNTGWLVLSLAFLLFSQSRTAWAGLFVAFGGAMVVSPAIHATKKMVVALVMLALVVFLMEPIYEYLSRGFSMERLLTLSGRVSWWEAALTEFLSADLIGKTVGLGFMTANREILVAEFDAGGAATLHSDFVDALVSSGIVGFSMICVSLIATVRHAVWLVRRQVGHIPLELFGVLLILLVRAFTGTTIASHNIFLVLFFAISVLAWILRREYLLAPQSAVGTA